VNGRILQQAVVRRDEIAIAFRRGERTGRARDLSVELSRAFHDLR
jgi:hypothetical protein